MLRVALLASNDLEGIDALAACAQLRIISLAANTLGQSRLAQHRVKATTVLPALCDLVSSAELTDLDLSANFLTTDAQHSLRAAVTDAHAANAMLRLDLSRQVEEPQASFVEREAEETNVRVGPGAAHAKKND